MLINIFLLVFIIVTAVLLLKLNLYLLYVWQNYEYRIDRLFAYLKSTRSRYDWMDLLVPWHLFLIRRPTITPKISLIFVLSIYLQINIFLKGLKPLSHSLGIQYYFFLSVLLILWLILVLSPIISALSAFLCNIPSFLVKKYIIKRARQKIRKYSKLVKIGITGSYGKSTTKDILAHLLETKYKVLKTKSSINTEIGIARTILSGLDDKIEVFVVEMGAYKVGEIKRICELVRPQIGMITGITEQHLELFGSLYNIMQAKYELIKALPASGLALFNISDIHGQKLYNKPKKVKKIAFKRPKKNYQTNLQASFLQENIHGAVLIAKYLKLDPKKINKALKKIPSGLHFLRKTRGLNACMVYDNSYNTNPKSFLTSLKFLKPSRKNKNIIITPGIIELGPQTYKVHRMIAKEISKVAGTLILTNYNFYRLFKKELDPAVRLLVYSKKLKMEKILSQNKIVLMEGRIPKHIYNKIING